MLQVPMLLIYVIIDKSANKANDSHYDEQCQKKQNKSIECSLDYIKKLKYQ